MSSRYRLSVCWTSIFLLVLVGMGASAGAQVDSQNTTDADRVRDARIKQFVDRFMAREMRAMSVPGACIAIVDHGVPVVESGFGVADVASGKPVDPAQTSFRIASVGKTFTALAVLKVAELGDIDLDLPVSKYLDQRFLLPPHVTSRRLLLHTAGLDERLIGYQSRRAAGYPALGEHLAKRLPAIQFNPDGVPSYSNYGYGLAGYVVESVTRTPFRDWVEAKVFEPLGMEHSYYLIPPLDDRNVGLATEYHGGGDVQSIHFSNPYPAGGIASTARDMGRFLQALLGSYAGTDTAVIPAAVARAMMTQQLRLIPQLEGLGFGLNQQLIDGQRLWLKGGSAPKHSAMIAILPDRQSAVFVAVNRQEPRFWELFLEEFVREFHPGSNRPADQGADLSPPAPAAEGVSGDGIAGVYELTRTSRSTIEKIAAPLFQVRVRTMPDASIVIESLSDDIPSGPFIHQQRGIFRNKNQYAGFKQGQHDRYLLMNVAGEHFAFRSVPWYANRGLHLWLFCLSATVVWSFPIMGALVGVKRRITGNPRRTPEDRVPFALMCYFVAAALMAVVVAAAYTVVHLESNIFGETIWLMACSSWAVVFAGAVFFLTARCASAIWLGGRGIRLAHAGGVAISGLALVALFGWYNVLWFRY